MQYYTCFFFFFFLALVQKLEESIKVNSYLVKEKLPKEIANQKKYINDLQKIISQPALTRADLDQINAKVKHNILLQ